MGKNYIGSQKPDRPIQDFMRRPLKPGDFVVISGKGTDTPPIGGIFDGKNVRIIKYNYTKDPNDSSNDEVISWHGTIVYLIEHPGETELRTIARIKAAEERHASKRAETKKILSTQKANEVGRVYVFAKNNIPYLYCGKCRVKTTSTYEPNKETVVEGHLYLPGGKPDYNEDSSLWTFEHFIRYLQNNFDTYEDDKHIRTVKGIKNFTASQQVIEVPQTFTLVAKQYVYEYTQEVTRL